MVKVRIERAIAFPYAQITVGGQRKRGKNK